MKFYYAAGTCALATHIALEEVGADYVAVGIDFSKNQQRSSDFLTLNPKGRVPALVTDKGVLTETPALLFYIAQTHPDADLAPLGDPYQLAALQSFNSYLCSTVHVAHAHKLRGSRWADEVSSFDDMKRKVPETMLSSMMLVEDGMLAGPYVMGEDYSIADMYLFTLARWLEGDGVDVERLPGIIAHRNRMRARPAVKRALAAQGLD
ncbi:glutathione S-transferase family protein [Aestuariispira insulae]|uniref:Glutathione S-transferase n=1 Tax=Aestuariispira insulae TaxID=1461337 RepID=A0A3D9HFC1_9PROT|nr:glutathione S-transferase N-terminal domain-containing protein [Aestuariispira insulae]RED48145.1 glutathione S-transferase [Aestuariispira insulae]